MTRKEIYANVDFYSASVYHMMGIPRDLLPLSLLSPGCRV